MLPGCRLLVCCDIDQARAENGMSQIRLRLGHGRDRIVFRHTAVAEAFDLGKDEPHPVASLLAGAKLVADSRVDRLLRVDENPPLDKPYVDALLTCSRAISAAFGG